MNKDSLVIFPLHPAFKDPTNVNEIHFPFAEKFLSLKGGGWKCVKKWVTYSPPSWLKEVVLSYKSASLQYLKIKSPDTSETQILQVLLLFLHVLSRINSENGYDLTTSYVACWPRSMTSRGVWKLISNMTSIESDERTLLLVNSSSSRRDERRPLPRGLEKLYNQLTWGQPRLHQAAADLQSTLCYPQGQFISLLLIVSYVTPTLCFCWALRAKLNEFFTINYMIWWSMKLCTILNCTLYLCYFSRVGFSGFRMEKKIFGQDFSLLWTNLTAFRIYLSHWIIISKHELSGFWLFSGVRGPGLPCLIIWIRVNKYSTFWPSEFSSISIIKERSMKLGVQQCQA